MTTRRGFLRCLFGAAATLALPIRKAAYRAVGFSRSTFRLSPLFTAAAVRRLREADDENWLRIAIAECEKASVAALNSKHSGVVRRDA